MNEAGFYLSFGGLPFRRILGDNSFVGVKSRQFQRRSRYEIILISNSFVFEARILKYEEEGKRKAERRRKKKRKAERRRRRKRKQYEKDKETVIRKGRQKKIK